MKLNCHFLRLCCTAMAGVLLTASTTMLFSATPKDKSSYRGLETDRPDVTESPITVDKGLFQLESSFFSFTEDKNKGTEVEVLNIATSNIKYGLLDNVDLQVMFTPYVKETVDTGPNGTTAEDFSDVTVLMKYNIWGNDGGETAFGLLPFVKIPTQTEVSNGRWEGGIVAPFSWSAGERWGVGAQVQLDRIYNEDDRDMDWDFGHTAVVGFDVTERVGAYVEYVGFSGDHPYQAFFSAGTTFEVREWVRLDAGTLIGLNDDSDDFTVFSGIGWKF